LGLALLTAVVGAAFVRAAPPQADTTETFIVLYKAQSVPPDAAAAIAAAGGTLVQGFDQIGVAVARSDSVTFRNAVLRDKRVEGVAATTGFGARVSGLAAVEETAALAAGDPWGDPLSDRQWDMVQIHAPEAQAINSGSPSVVVGDIDTGLDYTHPDLAANVDFANSVSCVSGVPNQDPAAWMDDNGHGTHTAGIIAAARNGIGIVGVAPNVRVAGIKAGNAGEARDAGADVIVAGSGIFGQSDYAAAVASIRGA
jgi:subtilisin family serine protease